MLNAEANSAFIQHSAFSIQHCDASSSSFSIASASASFPTLPPTATRAATRSATSHGRFHFACRRCAASGFAVSRLSMAWGRTVAARRVWTDGGVVAREGFGDRPLGVDGARARSAVSGLSQRVPGGCHGAFEAASGAARSATRRRPARRSSTSSDPSTCGPVRRSSTRRLTASSRLPRTRTSCRCRSCIDLRDRVRSGGHRPRRRPRDRQAVCRRSGMHSSERRTVAILR